MKNTIFLSLIIFLLLISCSQNPIERAEKICSACGYRDVEEFTDMHAEYATALKAVADEYGEEKARSIISEAFKDWAWIEKPEEFNLLLEFAENSLKSCDTNAVLFAGYDYIGYAARYAQKVLGLRQDVTYVQRDYLNQDRYWQYLREQTTHREYFADFEPSDTVDISRELFEFLHAKGVPCHQKAECYAIEFPDDSSFFIGIVRKYRDPSLPFRNAKENLDLAKTNCLSYDEARALFKEKSELNSLDYALNYFSAAMLSSSILCDSGYVEDVEKYLLEPIEFLQLQRVQYGLWRYTWAVTYERPDTLKWRKLIRDNWEEAKKYIRSDAQVEEYRKSVFGEEN